MDSQLLAHGITRRTAITLLISTVGAQLVGACTAAPSALPQAISTASATSSASAASQPKSGGTLRIGNTTDPSKLDGHIISPAIFDTLWMSYDTLTRYDQNLQPQPMLAESWDASSDGKQLKLNLRKGVQFHNGRELTSDDVLWNIMRVRDPKVGVAQLANQSAWFSDVQTPDKYTVILKSDAPRPAVFDFTEYLNILDKESTQGIDASKALGTGPFTFVEYAQGQYVHFARNKNYWQSGRPYLDEVQVSLLGDQQSMVAALEGGGLDAIINPPVRDAARLKQDPKWQVTVNPTSGYYYLMMANTTVPPLDNKLVRQALSYAMDRSRFASTVLVGLYETRDLPWPKHSPAYDPTKNAAQAFDLDKARSLLAQAGVSNVQLDVVYTSTNAELAGLAQILQSDFSQIGVNLTIKPLEDAVWRDQNSKISYQGVNLALGGVAGMNPSSLFNVSVFWSPTNGTTGFKSDAYTQLVTSASTEPDTGKRKAIYDQMNDYILDQSFVISATGNAPVLATSSRVHDLHHSVHEALVYTDAWMG